MPENFQKLGGAARFLGGVLVLLGGTHSLLTLGILSVKGMARHAGGWLGLSLAVGLLVISLGQMMLSAGRALRSGDVAALRPLGRALVGLGMALLVGVGSLLLGEFVLWILTWAPLGGC